jgi:hypothetical protein
LPIILSKESTRAGPAREPFCNPENGDADCAGRDLYWEN